MTFRDTISAASGIVCAVSMFTIAFSIIVWPISIPAACWMFGCAAVAATISCACMAAVGF